MPKYNLAFQLLQAATYQHRIISLYIGLGQPGGGGSL